MSKLLNEKPTTSVVDKKQKTMCGRYNITKKLVTLEKELDLQTIHRELFDGLVNIAPGDLAPIITHHQEEVQFFQFGMTPFWAKKKMYLFNARAEGDFNKENDKNYNGNKGILQKPAFRKPIRSQRCLVIANSFIEGDEKEKLNKPFLIFRKDFRSKLAVKTIFVINTIIS